MLKEVELLFRINFKLSFSFSEPEIKFNFFLLRHKLENNIFFLSIVGQSGMNKSILLNIPVINLDFLRSSFVHKIMNHILVLFSINLNFVLMILVNYYINVLPEDWRSSNFSFGSLDSVFDSSGNYS